jgi:uncharacterized protein
MARREGYEVLAIDAFADADTVAAAHSIWQLPALCGQLTSTDIVALLNTLDEWQPEYVLVGSGFEADIAGYEHLHQHYTVLGNLPAVIQQVKNPQWLANYCASRKVISPEIRFQIPDEGNWLYKQAGQCGGAHIKNWSANSNITADGYWQRFQAGQAIGALFLVNGHEISLIGVHALKQRSGQYAYAGAIRLHDEQLIGSVQDLLQVLVPDSGLVGINSIDAIWQNGQLHVLEINPRLSASMRLYADMPLIQAHIGSCLGNAPPILQIDNAYASHCICYALHAIEIEQLDFPGWVEDMPGHCTIAAGQPICSLYAQGRSDSEVLQKLQDKKTQLEKLWGPYVCEHVEFNIH